MPALLLAFALAAAAQAPTPKAPVIEPGTNLGAIDAGAAPTDDFGFVAWCAGAVEGYLKLKPAVLPEVRRIEGQFQRPGSKLEDDMKDYADMETEARRQMVSYQSAIQAAEKASPTPISDQGFNAYKRGLAVWAAPAGSAKSRIAQEWMSWSLPAKCETTAQTLMARASLFGEALKPSAGPAAAPAAAAPEAIAASGDTAPGGTANAATPTEIAAGAPAADPAAAGATAEPTSAAASPVPAEVAPAAAVKPTRKPVAKKKTAKPG